LRSRAGFPDLHPYPIRLTTGTNVRILNSTEFWKMTLGNNCKGIEPKDPIAK
jgi:hypothetical protein